MNKYIYGVIVLSVMALSGSTVFAGGEIELNPDGTVLQYQDAVNKNVPVGDATVQNDSSSDGRIPTLPIAVSDEEKAASDKRISVLILSAVGLAILGGVGYWFWKRSPSDMA